jgi:hypothetical protein
MATLRRSRFINSVAGCRRSHSQQCIKLSWRWQIDEVSCTQGLEYMVDWILRLRPTWLSDEEEHQGCLVCVLFCWLPFLIAKCQILRWRDFIQTRDDCVGLESSVVMSPKVWEASGHVENFVDPLVECKKWLCPLTVLTPHPPPLSQHMYSGSKTLLDRCCLSNLLCCYAAMSMKI